MFDDGSLQKASVIVRYEEIARGRIRQSMDTRNKLNMCSRVIGSKHV